MLPTHIVTGGFIGLVLSILDPSNSSLFIYLGMLAGILPDLDMFIEHRKTFHRPLQYFTGFIILLLSYLGLQSSYLLAFSVILGSMSIHCIFEIFGQGKTMNPDLKEDERCEYNHITGNWIKPRRKVKVGSGKDLILTIAFSAPLVTVSEATIPILVSITALSGLLMYLLNDWITKELLSDYDRFSEAIQYKIGLGPELSNQK
jgi:hypothetical protein